MTSYLGIDIFTIATINLVIQTVAYLILIRGFLFARKNNFRTHGLFMETATLLNFISLFIVMLPAFYSLVYGISFAVMPLPISITSVHHIIGLVALLMAVIAIAVLRPCGSVRGNKRLGNVRKYMIALFIIWTIAYFYGILIHLMFYYPSLMGVY